MRILFVFRNKPRGNQLHLALLNNLRETGVDIEIFAHESKGLVGYLSNCMKLRKFLSTNDFDVIHAHFSYSGYIAAIARRNEGLVCSLLGSDVNSAGKFSLRLLRVAIKYIWDVTIVKTDKMKSIIGIDSLYVIPNGVNFNRFYPMDSVECKRKVGFDPNKFNIIFISSDIDSPAKNYKLAFDSVNKLSNPEIMLHPLTNKTHEELLLYYNAADLLLFTSIQEGSPNVIKEAMACNLPIISTDVGDSRRTLANVQGCYIVDFSVDEVANHIELVRTQKKRTKGRENIPFLNSENTSKQIIEIYTSVKKAK